MILLIHIAVAITSLVLTTWSAFMPSMRRLYASYALIGVTLASGTYLVISLHTPMLRACATGLAYLGIALAGVLVANHRLAKQTADR